MMIGVACILAVRSSSEPYGGKDVWLRRGQWRQQGVPEWRHGSRDDVSSSWWCETLLTAVRGHRMDATRHIWVERELRVLYTVQQ